MRKRLSDKLKSSRGDVLAEFVIVLPLYIALISYCIWLGTLALGRSRVLSAERYATWGGGNRHGNAGGSTAYKQRSLDTIYSDMKSLDGMSIDVASGTYKHPGSRASRGTWTALNSSVCKVNLKPPVWLYGPMSLLNLKEASSTPQSVQLTAYGEETNMAMSLVLSRTNDTQRTAIAKNLCEQMLWQKIAVENYPSCKVNYSIGGLRGGAGSYTRWDDYVRWSE